MQSLASERRPSITAQDSSDGVYILTRPEYVNEFSQDKFIQTCLEYL